MLGNTTIEMPRGILVHWEPPKFANPCLRPTLGTAWGWGTCRAVGPQPQNPTLCDFWKQPLRSHPIFLEILETLGAEVRPVRKAAHGYS